MQHPPQAEALLTTVAELLESDVIAAVPDELKHRVRVAASICRIVGRETSLGPAIATAEHERLLQIVGPVGDLATLRTALVRRLDDPAPLTPDDDRAIREALLAGVRDDLSIAKPGYDR